MNCNDRKAKSSSSSLRRHDAIPLNHLEGLQKSIEELKKAVTTYVGDVVQTARIAKGILLCEMLLLFPSHGELNGLELWVHVNWIKQPADHHYTMQFLPATRRIVRRRGFSCEPHFYTFSLAGEVPPDYEPYFDFDINTPEDIDLDISEESSEDSDDSVHHFATFNWC